MSAMRNKQQGMTAIGFVIMAVIVALIGFAGLKLTPVYLEHMKIVSTLNDVKEQLDGQNPSIQEIRSSINKRLVIEMVTTVKARDFKIKKTEAGYDVRIQYENRTQYVANLYLVAVFNNVVGIRR
jgi:hypothetical protein